MGRPQGEDKVNAERLGTRAATPKAVNSEQRDGGAARTGGKDWVFIGSVMGDAESLASMMGGRSVPSLRRTLPG
jgi:hypothetical protein